MVFRYFLLFFILLSIGRAEYCPDCGLKSSPKRQDCFECGFQFRELRRWWEVQRRHIPGLPVMEGKFLCPHCEKRHRRKHFFCFHCGKALLQRVKKTVSNPTPHARRSDTSLKALLKKSGEDPGSLTEEEKASLAQWINQRPLAALLQNSSDTNTSSGIPNPASALLQGMGLGSQNKGNKVPDFTVLQLKSMLSP